MDESFENEPKKPEEEYPVVLQRGDNSRGASTHDTYEEPVVASGNFISRFIDRFQ